MKIIFLILTILFSLFAEVLQPIKIIKTSGSIKDMVLDKNKIIFGTDAGTLEVYDLTKNEIIKKIQLPDIKDFMGDTIHTRVASLDYMDGRFAFLSDSGIGGYTNVWLHENNQTKKIISHKDKKMIIKLRFIDKNHLLFAYLGNEVSLYEMSTKKYLYTKQLSESKFSDFALNEDKTKAVFANESGIEYVIDTKTGKILKTLKGQNVDNVYKVDFKNNFVSCAGKDRRGAYYDLLTGSGGYFKANFFIYTTALSLKATKVIYAMDEDNSLSLFNLSTKEKLAKLYGAKSRISNIIFQDENTIFAGSDDNNIYIWKLKEKK